jgi:hydrogenase maturation protease
VKRPQQILVAGVGNAWLRDDGFGGRVVERLQKLPLPEGVTVADFGTGGLDLAYEVMRGYDGLVLVDASQQGHEPGTLYLIEPEEASVPGAIENGDVLNPHGMDPATVLRFLKATNAWPGKVVIVACEPHEVEEMGLGLSPAVEGALDGAVQLVLKTVDDLLAVAAGPA